MEELAARPDPPSESGVARSRGLGRATPVALIATILPISGSIILLAAGPFIAMGMRGTGLQGAACFAIVYMILGGLMVAPTYTTSMIAGWAFGKYLGFATVLVGTVGGAMLCYVVARRFALDRVREAFQHHDKWETVRRAIVDEHPVKTLWVVFLLRLSPVLPFGTTNVLLATSGVRVLLFLFGTILGMIPRTFLIAAAAAGAEQLNFDKKESWMMLVAGLVATGLCIGVMVLIGKHALDRATRGSAQTVAPVKPTA